MSDAVEKPHGHSGIAEHVYPHCNVEIAGDNQGCFFMQKADGRK